jgi:peptidyl-prolyl cis-trans isomerase NIMA-interacting 1
MNRWLLVLLAVAACDKPSASTGAPASASAATQASVAPTTSPTAPATPTASSAPSATAAADSPPPDAIIAQHVLVAYRGAKRAPKGVARSKTEAKARAQEALAKIRAGSPFEDVVKQYSDDAGSADRMGSVGKFRRADMDPAFSSAAFALKPSEVSDVVETPFGFHVIKRTQ